MKEYAPHKLRNVALIGHGSTGKTSLAEAMLFASGATTRLGRVEDGTTVSDWDPDEQKRGLSVNLAVVPVEANGHKINVVDAPGYADFMGEAKCALRAADLALIVVCGASGVQVGTEFAWQFTEELSLPRAGFINRMDRENAAFNAPLGPPPARHPGRAGGVGRRGGKEACGGREGREEGPPRRVGGGARPPPRKADRG